MSKNYKLIQEYYLSGTVPLEYSTYVKRAADSELYEKLKMGSFCYVINSRQMGKSSLSIRTREKLKAEGFACISVDLSIKENDNNRWYNTLIFEIIEELRISDIINPFDWLKDNKTIENSKSFFNLIEKILSLNGKQKIFIFIDEIDSILNFPEKDNFFATIRFFYNNRAKNPIFNNITFALFGATSPSHLMQDINKTPFNIGEAIHLEGLRIENCIPLIDCFNQNSQNPKALMEAILYWTGGQPFLTQKLCKMVKDNIQSINQNQEKYVIEDLVKKNIITNWESQDFPEHLKTIQNRILQNPQKATVRMLSLYQKILSRELIPTDGTVEQIELRLSGLVAEKNNYLSIVNPIYETIFNKDWILKSLAALQPYSEQFHSWLKSNKQENSYLLSGSTLREATSWAQKNRADDTYWEYVALSEKLERQKEKQEQEKQEQLAKAEAETQKIAREKAENEITAQKLLALQQLNSNKKLRYLSASLAVMLLIVISAIISALDSNKKLAITNESLAKSRKELEIKQIETEKRRKESEQAKLEIEVTNNQLQFVIKQLNEAQAISEERKKEAIEQKNLAVKDKIKFYLSEGEKYSLMDDINKALVYFAEAYKLSESNRLNIVEAEKCLVKAMQTHDLSDFTFRGHEDFIELSNFSKDKHKAVTSRYQNTIEPIIIATDGYSYGSGLNYTQLVKLKGHVAYVTSASFSPDGTKIVTTSADQTAKIWQVETQEKVTELGRETRRPLFTLEDHTDKVNMASFSRDSKRVATVSDDKTAKIWDSDTGTLLVTLRNHTDKVTYVSFSRDGTRLVTASNDKTAKIWDSGTGKLLFTLQKHTDIVNSALFSRNGNKLITTSDDKTVRIWDTQTGKLLLTLNNFTDKVQMASFSPSERKILTSTTKELKIWDTSSAKELVTLEKPFESSEFIPPIVSVDFSPIEDTIVISNVFGQAHIWDINTGKKMLVKENSNDVYSASFSSDGNKIVTTSADKTIKIWDSTNFKLLKTLGEQKSKAYSASFSKNDRFILTTDSNKIAKLWDIITGEIIHIIGNNNNQISSAIFSLEGNKIITSGNTTTIWDTKTGKSIFTLPGYINQGSSDIFLSDNKIITREEKKVIVFDINTGKELISINQKNRINSASFSSDGNKIVTTSADGMARVWNIKTGNNTVSFQCYPGALDSAIFSPDDNKILTVGLDKPDPLRNRAFNSDADFVPTIKIWDINTGNKIDTIQDHKYIVGLIAFSYDGTKLLTLSSDIVRIWDAKTLKKLFSLKGHTNHLYSAFFSPDGNKVTTASSDNTAKIWNINPPKRSIPEILHFVDKNIPYTIKDFALAERSPLKK